MLALIDSDLLLYKIGFTTQNDEEWVAKARFNEMVEGILAETNADQYQLWLSDKTSNNFRTKFYPEYKANRKDFVLPVHYHALKEHALGEWGAKIAIEQEADDALGIEQTKYNGWLDNPEYGGDGSFIASIDKDLDQVPGSHYNFDKKVKYFVTPEQGLRHFYTQLLVGDSSDHIQGCPKVGPVKAETALIGLTTEGELFHAARCLYVGSYAKHLKINDLEFVDSQILQNGRCLKIRTEENQIWSFPKSKVTAATELSSTPLTPVASNPSTELGLQSSPTGG